jgi:hypothetical protein
MILDGLLILVHFAFCVLYFGQAVEKLNNDNLTIY